MTPFAHMGPEWFDRPWWGAFGWLLPLLLVAGLTGLVVWSVTRTPSQQTVPGAPVGPPPPLPVAAVAPTVDPAVEAARLRYARGETTREEFLQAARDLGGGATALDAAEEGEPDA